MSLTGKKIKNAYLGLLALNAQNQTLSATPQLIQDGAGNLSTIALATDRVIINNNTMPTSAGTTGQFLTSDGAGNLTWASAATDALTEASADAKYWQITNLSAVGQLNNNVGYLTSATQSVWVTSAYVDNNLVIYANDKTPKFYGAVADGITDNTTAFDNFMLGGGGVIDGVYKISGQLSVYNNTKIIGTNNAVIKFSGRSLTGSSLTNVIIPTTSSEATNIVLKDLIIDGSAYPTVQYFTIVSATTSAIWLNTEAPAVDNFFNGYYVEPVSGTNVGLFSIVESYTGSTRKLKLFESILFPSVPTVNTQIAIGFNDNATGFARGLRNLYAENLTFKNYPQSVNVPSAAGSKGINFEQGCFDSKVNGLSVYNCGTAFFASGKKGLFSNGVPQGVLGIRANNIYAENCGSVITLSNLDGEVGISAAPNENDIIVNNVQFKNCGHAPNRFVSSNKQKSGIINLFGTNGSMITNVRGYNESSYPASYPSDFATRVGFGLSGPVGALIWGHARNTQIKNVFYNGNADTGIHFGRVRALGDDAGPTGVVNQCFNFQFTELVVDGTLQTGVRIDPVLPCSAAAINGYIDLTVSSLSVGFVASSMSSFNDLVIKITELSTGKTVIGSPALFLTNGNNFTSYGNKFTNLFSNQVFARLSAPNTFVRPIISTAPNNLSTNFIPLTVGAGGDRGITGVSTSQLGVIIGNSIEAIFVSAGVGLLNNNYVVTRGKGDDRYIRIETNVSGARSIMFDTDSAAAPGYTWNSDTSTGMFRADSNTIGFSTGGTELARMVSTGLLVGRTSLSFNNSGVYMTKTGNVRAEVDSGSCIDINRLSNDGTVLGIYQAGTLEGAISVAGTTVTYGAFAGAHWSQTIDNSKPVILRGTVMETIDEMCEWVNEGNDQLPKVKISDTISSNRVYGVFGSWDNDDTVNNDMNIIGLGAYVIRINSTQTVYGGELLESNGDGSARIQSDDIIRSKTIAKVTSPTIVETYPDGSYLVPCVLYCG